MKAIARNILLQHLQSNYVSRAGRPRQLEIGYVIERIAYVLRTGCQWTNLPVENGSWKTIYHYFAQWSKQHVFERAFLDVLRFYLRRRGGVSKNIVVDTSFVKNVWGRDCLGKSPVDRGRKATKVSAITDNVGTPLYLLFHPGNKYRRIIMRYDGLVCHFRSFHFLAALQIVASKCAFFETE